MREKSESGVVLIAVLLILVLLAVLLEGFILSANSEQQLSGIDRGQSQAFYGALAGMEKLTAGLGDIMLVSASPTQAQLDALVANAPAFPNVSYVPQDGEGAGLAILKGAEATRTIPSGNYGGLIGEITPYTVTATAHTLGGVEEVKMQRDLNVVLIPVFQFGIFSQTDLSFFAGPTFNFGGRVHTNGNLYLAEGDGNTLTMGKRITVVGNVYRSHLSNTWPTSSNYNGRVSITGGTPPELGQSDESSNSNWTNIKNNLHGQLLNGDPDVKIMNLPIVADVKGATPIDLIRRPVVGENSTLTADRHFTNASMRILLSKTQDQIKTLPGVTQTNPVLLSGTIAAAGDTAGIDTIAASTGAGNYKSQNNTSTIDDYIKIEIQLQAGGWQDVTAEILGYGVTGPDLNINGAGNNAPICPNIGSNAIIRVQHLQDAPPACTTNQTKDRYWPNVLYDAREGALRGNVANNLYQVFLGGVMHYIELDVSNLNKWFRTQPNGQAAKRFNEGVEVYFSDRRTNQDLDGKETGEYGNEDVINSWDPSTGLPDGGDPAKFETPEDVNDNGKTDVYGQVPVLPPQLPAGASSPLDGNARPNGPSAKAVATIIARVNKPIFFRRALKLINGGTINLGNNANGTPYGLTVVSENPVYVQGNYNVANGVDPNTTPTSPHAATAIMADAVTLLSNNWNDLRSFNCPHTTAATCQATNLPGRVATDTSYRVAIVAGKGKSFTGPLTHYQDFGTDGGVHNFLRFLENWGNKNLKYRGSIVSLYYNRQATGTYKCGENDVVYSPPSRGYNFDDDYLTPALLPPDTPRFMDINITGFTQLKRPNQ